MMEIFTDTVFIHSRGCGLVDLQWAGWVDNSVQLSLLAAPNLMNHELGSSSEVDMQGWADEEVWVSF